MLQRDLEPLNKSEARAIAPVIQMENIYRIYGSGDVAIRACDNVGLTIEAGEYCAIMGQSGSGKTTLMNLIGCLDRPTAGRYCLDGLDVARLGKRRLARIRNRKLGFVFQRYELLANLTALDNVILPMMYAGMSPYDRKRRATAALNCMGLSHRLHKKPYQLSGGQQQRVAIARAIVNRPVLLLADEPTGALDTQSAKEVINIFDALHASGMTIVLVTHSREVACYSDRIIMMSDGKVLDDNLAPSALSQLAPL